MADETTNTIKSPLAVQTKPLPTIIKETVDELKDATVSSIQYLGQGIGKGLTSVKDSIRDSVADTVRPIKDGFIKAKDFTVDFTKGLFTDTVQSMNPVSAMFGDTVSSKLFGGLNNIFEPVKDSFERFHDDYENDEEEDRIIQFEKPEPEFERRDDFLDKDITDAILNIDEQTGRIDSALMALVSTNEDFNNLYKSNEERRRREEQLKSISNRDVPTLEEPEPEREIKSEKKLKIGDWFKKLFGGKGLLGKGLSLGGGALAMLGSFATGILNIWKWVAVADGAFKFVTSLMEGNSVLDSIKLAVKTFFDDLLFPVYWLFDTLLGNKKGTAKAFTHEWIDNIIDSIYWLGEKLGEFVAWIVSGQAWTDTKNAVLNFMNAIGNWISDLWNSISTWWNETPIWENTVNFVQSIGSWISGIWDSIVNWWNETPIWENTVNFVQSIGNWISDLWSKIKEWWSSFDFKQSAINIWDSICNWIKGAITLITQWWTGERSFKDDALNFAKAISDWISDKLNVFVEWLTKAWDKFTGWIKNSKVGKWIWGDKEEEETDPSYKDADEETRKILDKVRQAQKDGVAIQEVLNNDELDKWREYAFSKLPRDVDIQPTTGDIAKQNIDKKLNNIQKETVINHYTNNNTVVQNNNMPQTSIVNQSTQMVTPISTDDNGYGMTRLNYGMVGF